MIKFEAASLFKGRLHVAVASLLLGLTNVPDNSRTPVSRLELFVRLVFSEN